MTEIIVDLTKYPERFEKDSKLVLNKKVNFIFGKNGTGKSTIADKIEQEFGDTKNVLVFRGFENIIEKNKPLNAIALGTENAEIQKKINEIDKQISSIENILNPDNGNNLGSKQIKIQKEYEKIIGNIDKCHIAFASTIKKIPNLKISTTNYDKTDFKNEINLAKELQDNEVKTLKEIIKGEKMDLIKEKELYSVNPNYYLKKTNNILIKSIKLQVNIEELDKNIEKQNFAKEGMKIHTQKKDEKCAFCGNIITDERWNLLKQYFNKNVGNLETDIDNVIKDIDTEISMITGITELNKDLFYEHLKPLVIECNKSITSTKNEYIIFLNNLKDSLINKKKKLFSVCNEIKLEKSLPNFTIIEKEIKNIIESHNNLSNNLRQEQIQAANKLRYNEISKLIKTPKYQKLLQEEPIKKKEKENIDKEIKEKKEEIELKNIKRLELINSTKDEGKIADNINRCLKSSGIESFKLKLISSTEKNGKGQYIIEGHDGKEREIDKISKGEKNIIAFLYFYYSIGSPENSKKNRIIIFDDPMSSNDDRLQYLMTTKINEIYSKKLKKGDMFLLLTHNIHFYLNSRPYNENNKNKLKEKEETYYDKNHYYKLQQIGNITKIIQIKSEKEDYKTNYHELRDDLKFMYNENRKLAMINTCRRILETYRNFNCINLNNFFSGNEEAQKLFNVNSHGIEDLENDINGKEKDDILYLFKEILKKNDGEKHYKYYFNSNNNIKE